MTPRLIAVGDNVVDCYPDLGVMFPGGNAVNVAVHVRRTGGAAAYVGVLGTDGAGDLLRSALEREQVDTALVRTENGPNAYAVVRLVDGNRVFEKGEVGVSRFSLDERDLTAVASADMVHTGECSMVEADLPRIASAARLLSFDFSERPWDYVRELAPYVDVAILSAVDTEQDPTALARGVAELGPSVVAVTQGVRGATLWAGRRMLHAPAGTGPVVDTLGAGDAFIARLLVGLARGEQPDALLAAATSYATATCADHGAFGYESPLPPPATSEEVAGGPTTQPVSRHSHNGQQRNTQQNTQQPIARGES
jgi:sugar/nucleoside kinase (ribokinase family)